MGILADPDALPQLIGSYRPADEWQQHINTLFYGFRRDQIRDIYQTFATADYRLAHALAVDYIEKVRKREKTAKKALSSSNESSSASSAPAPEEELVIHEWGCGNGNLAACFLSHLETVDTEKTIYPRVRYVLVDNQKDVLAAALAHPDLGRHLDRVETLCADVTKLETVTDGTVDRIICNELWNDLPTKLITRNQSDFEEEFLRPNLKESRFTQLFQAEKWPPFVKAFDELIIEPLLEHHPFLEDIIWEKEYRKVEWKEVPFRKTITDMLKHIDEQVVVPVNVGACLTLQEAQRLLRPDSIGFSSFDAGTGSLDVLNDPEKPCYGQFGGQFSFIVNFLLLEQVAKFLGMATRGIEPQGEFVGEALAVNVVSLMDLLSTHPSVVSMKPWEQDQLVLRTIEVLNSSYSSPYSRKIEFPLQDGAPDSERQAMLKIIASLKDDGIPDTIAYLTEEELTSASHELEALGYDQDAIKAALSVPPHGVDYSHMWVGKSER